MGAESVATVSMGRVCEVCGESLSGRPQKRYCSAACRAKRYDREHPRLGQQRLPFDPEALPLPTLTVPSPEERPRLQRACWRILARLEQGPATGWDLIRAGGGTRYGARLGELRAAGYDIPKPETDKATGRAVYEWVR